LTFQWDRFHEALAEERGWEPLYASTRKAYTGAAWLAQAMNERRGSSWVVPLRDALDREAFQELDEQIGKAHGYIFDQLIQLNDAEREAQS